MKNKSFRNNVSWVFFGNLLYAIFAFFLNIFVARFLSKEDYGTINYIASWISFFNAFAVLGINNVINKYLDENTEKSNEYINSAMFARIISSILSIILLTFLMFIIEHGNISIIYITLIYSLSFVFEIGQVLIYWFRYKREAKIVAIMRLIAFLISAIVKMLAVLLFENIYLYTFGIVLETLLFSLLLIYKYRKEYTNKIKISKDKIVRILKTSYPFISASLLITIYAQTDKIMLKKMLSTSDVASYSVAVTIAGLMATFASAIIEGYRPEIISCFRTNKEMYFRRLRQLYCFIFWLCMCYGIFITIFSKYVILLLYGEKYLSSISALSIIVWYTSFSYFGVVNNLYMVAENKERYVQITTLTGAITNILLNLLLIPKYGIVGAAIASLITQFITNFGLLFVIKDLRPIIPLLIKGIFFRNIVTIKKRKIEKDV